MVDSIYKPLKAVSNTIFRGDNLEIMRALPEECVDLCYIDPPFFTQKDYKNIWGDKESVLDWDAKKLDGFFDTKDFFEKHVNNGEKGLVAYLSWLRFRLVEIHRLLKKGGSFYCHLDYHAVHYVKVILDEVFGYKNFRNEIVWQRKSGGSGASNGEPRNYPNSADLILFYSKGDSWTYNQQYFPHGEEYLEKAYRHVDENGRRFRIDNIAKPEYDPKYVYPYKGYAPPEKGWRYPIETMRRLDKEGRLHFPKNKDGRIQVKRYLDEMSGIPVSNIWTDIGVLQNNSAEKTGWPTQKPVALLERIIKTSSNEGDVVFDCFAGCGTAMHAAHNLKRKWVGIDISPTAVKVNKKRLIEAKAKVEDIDENDLPVRLKSIDKSSTKQKKSA
jgi:site-specific DNA-methyltransferase (adenine-specific)